MRRANNCNANLWKCSSCHFRKRANCLDNVRQHLQMEALKKYGNTPQIKKAIDERLKNKNERKKLAIEVE